MKYLLISALFVINFTASATELDQKTLDQLSVDIDNICGDTYCEGDFNWGHSNLKCDLEAGYCTLDMDLKDQFYMSDVVIDDVESLAIYADRLNFEEVITKRYDFLFLEIDEDYSRSVEYSKLCIIPKMFTIEDVMSGGSYSEKLIESVIDCATEMEEEYYKLVDSVNSVF